MDNTNTISRGVEEENWQTVCNRNAQGQILYIGNQAVTIFNSFSVVIGSNQGNVISMNLLHFNHWQ
jgi:hypothetical protein